MAHVGGGESALLEERFLEGKDYVEVIDGLAHGGDPAFAPGPDLGGDEIEHGDAQAAGVPGEAEMESREIDQDDGVRPAFPPGLGGQPADPENLGQVLDHFHEADQGQAGQGIEDFDAGGFHFGAAESREMEAGEYLVEFSAKPGGVQIGGFLTGRDEQVPGFGHG